MQLDRVAFDLAQNVLQIIGVEPDFKPGGLVIGRDFFGRSAVIRRSDRERDLVVFKRHFDRAGLFSGNRGDAVHPFPEAFGIELEQLVIPGRDHPAVIGESPVDQLAGQHDAVFAAERKAHFAGRQIDQHVGTGRFFEQFAQLVDAFARNDHVGHAIGAIGLGNREARQPVAVSGSSAQLIIGYVQENTIEVIARFFGADRKFGAIDHLREQRCAQFKAGRQITLDDHREIIARQGRQRKPAAPGFDGHPVVGRFQADLTAIRQLARDVEQQMRRNGDRARDLDRDRAQAFDHLQVQIGCHDLERAIRRRLDQDVRQDRDRIAPLDDGLDVRQALQKCRAFDGGLHGRFRPHGAHGRNRPMRR